MPQHRCQLFRSWRAFSFILLLRRESFRSFRVKCPLMRIALDTGGTFTDCVFLRDGKLEILKVPSQPKNPAAAIAAALSRVRAMLGDKAEKELDLVCGTTVGTNALLERRGGKVLLITTAGFEDVLEIGRQARAELYDLQFQKAPPLVPRERT